MSFSFPVARLGPLRIEHLQLDERTTDAFRRRGVRSISDLVKEIGRERYPTKEGLEAAAALERLADVCGPVDVDWLTFWQGNGYRFHHRFFTCPELEGMDSSNAVCGVGKVNFGNAGRMLNRAGISTLGDLAKGLRDGLPDVPAMGAKKWAELFGTLVELVREIREGRMSEELLTTLYPVDGAAPILDVEPPPSFDLQDGPQSLHIGVLHLGTKASTLEAQGIRTVGDAATALPSLLSLAGIGRATVTALDARLARLAQAQTVDGDIDWERYCTGIGVPLLPRAGDPADAATFVGGLAGVIAEIGEELDDGVLQLIIKRRLSRLPHERATLEDIGSAEGVNLTRERVRQIESRFLRWMVAALLDDNYSNLNVHFRPGFASFWRAAADRFSGSEEISNSNLTDGLAEVWRVDAATLTEHLPIIVTIMTGDVPSGKLLGDGARLGKELLRRPHALSSVPIRKLQLGKSVQALEAHGLDNLGKLVDAIRTGAISRGSGSRLRSAINHLVFVEDALDEDGTLNWEAYRVLTGMEVLPADPATNPALFLQILNPTLTKLLEIGNPTKRSAVIFARRTSHPVMDRISTEALAKELGTHGPTIKREETDLLVFLNEVLIGGNLALAGAHVRDDFLSMWNDAAEQFEAADGDAANFKMHLAEKWQIGSAVVEAALPTIVAVLTGYPYKRLGRYTRMAAVGQRTVIPLPIAEPDGHDMPVRIVLRGFRRQH
jgi:hypothetical protein